MADNCNAQSLRLCAFPVVPARQRNKAFGKPDKTDAQCSVPDCFFDSIITG
jgi:hypothetical protein